jgi:hypothetical protein
VKVDAVMKNQYSSYNDYSIYTIEDSGLENRQEKSPTTLLFKRKIDRPRKSISLNTNEKIQKAELKSA